MDGHTWQGSNVEPELSCYNTIYEALANKYGKDNVTLEPGVTYDEKGAYWKENTPEIDKAVKAADGADVIVACVGENSYTETPGNLTDLTLSENQRNLVKALAKTGKPIILVLNEGRPRLVADIEPLSAAVINVLLPEPTALTHWPISWLETPTSQRSFPTLIRKKLTRSSITTIRSVRRPIPWRVLTTTTLR